MSLVLRSLFEQKIICGGGAARKARAVPSTPVAVQCRQYIKRWSREVGEEMVDVKIVEVVEVVADVSEVLDFEADDDASAKLVAT